MAELIVAQNGDFSNGFVSETFGRLKTIGPTFAIHDGKQHRSHQECLCECGNRKIIRVGSLRSGKTQSCGCLQTAAMIARNTTHGMQKTSEYRSWQAMKRRCDNPNCKDYPDYGARGIGYCERWKKFENFFADMGEKPSPKHSIDRERNAENYCPENCRWSTNQEQANNRRSNRLVTIGDKTDTLTNWARHYKMKIRTVHDRVGAGWDPVRALTTPPKQSSLNNA